MSRCCLVRRCTTRCAKPSASWFRAAPIVKVESRWRSWRIASRRQRQRRAPSGVPSVMVRVGAQGCHLLAWRSCVASWRTQPPPAPAPAPAPALAAAPTTAQMFGLMFSGFVGPDQTSSKMLTLQILYPENVLYKNELAVGAGAFDDATLWCPNGRQPYP